YSMQNGSGAPPRSTRPRQEGGANRRMFASIQSTLRSGKEFRPDGASAVRNERGPRRREHTPVVLKSVDEVIEQLADLERRGEHSTSQIKQNLEASSSTLDEMWDEEWTKLVDVLIKMCLESDEAVFVVDLLPLFMKYSNFVDLFRERMLAVASEFVLPSEGGEGEGHRLEQVPAFFGSLLCARWPRGMHRDTHESNPVLFTAFEIVRGWLMVVQEGSEGERKDDKKETEKVSARWGGVEPLDAVADALQDGCRIDGEEEEEGAEPAADPAHLEDEEEAIADSSPELLNRCCSALAALCESQQRSLWLSRPELVDDMYKCIKVAIIHNRQIDGGVKCALLHTYLLMNEWTRSKAVTTKCAATQTAAS
ncbi:hypothetical protein PENTCL1PPCAC_13242, partial [Pristionchus entomophagus]